MASLIGVLDAQGGVVTAATADRDLLGTWEATDRPWRIEFAPDGVIRMSTRGRAKTGTYRLDAKGILWVRMDTGREYTSQLKLVHQDQLQLIHQNGSLTTFRRVG
jgi:hypothetical protein